MSYIDRNITHMTSIQQLVLTTQDIINMFSTGIYAIHHIKYPEKLYIGSASKLSTSKYKSGFYARWCAHLSEFRLKQHHAKYLQNVVNKYGLDGLRFTILETCTVKEVLIREQYYLDSLKPVYNTLKTAGNSEGYKHTNSTKKLMSNQRRGKSHSFSIETRLKMSQKAKLRNIDYLRSPEVLEKRSKNSKGKRASELAYEAIRKPIKQYSKQDVFIKEYVSIAEASDETKIDRASISKAATGSRPSAGGYKWSF